MTQILATLVLADIIIAGLKTFGLAEPITWTAIYWGFIGLTFIATGVDDE